jgi:hypothetical protein
MDAPVHRPSSASPGLEQRGRWAEPRVRSIHRNWCSEDDGGVAVADDAVLAVPAHCA